MLSEHMTTAERLRQPDDGALAQSLVGVLATVAEAEQFIEAVDRFHQLWPGLLDVRIHRRDTVLYTHDRSPSALKQAHALLTIWSAGNVAGRNAERVRLQRLSGATE